jgi:hypothetical protein
MPDLKTALTNAIQEKQMQTTAPVPAPTTPDTVLKTVREWAVDDARARIPREPKYTGFLTRDIFLYIQANPKSTMKQVEKAIVQLPYKYNKGSCGTLMSQMVKAGLMSRDEESRYSTAVESYTPVNKNKTRRKYTTTNKRPSAIKQASAKAGPPPKAVETAPKMTTASELDQLLTRLTFVQALELYKKLRDMLGAVTRMPLP